MKVHLQKLPQEIYDRLKEISEKPAQWSGFYIQHRYVGMSIFGLIVFAIALIVGFVIAQDNNDLPYLAWFGCAFAAAWIAIVSYHYLKDYKAANIKPYFFINPLYIIKVGMEDVIYYSLWKDKKDVKILHHYTNGAYTGTDFTFWFHDGGSLSFQVSPKATADSLIDLLETYRLAFIEAIEKENFENLLSHDLFYEMSEPKNQERLDENLYPSPKSRSKWTTFFQIGMAASILSAFFYYFAMYFTQKRDFDYCSSSESYEQFIERYPFNFFKSAAKEKIYIQYKQDFEKNKENVQELRKMVQKKDFSSLLTPDRQEEIIRLYQEEGKKQIEQIYKKLDNYKPNINIPAKEALLKILEFAKKNRKCPVAITYTWETGKIQGSFPIVTILNERKVAQGANIDYVNNSNQSKKSWITDKIQEILKNVIPYGIAEMQNSGDIVIKVYAAVHPSEFSYEFSKSTGIDSDFFQGIEYHWTCQIFLKEEEIFSFSHISIPPENIKVTYMDYGYGSSITASSVYDKMIENAFDDFGAMLLKQWR